MPAVRMLWLLALSGCAAEWSPADGFEPDPVNAAPSLSLSAPQDGAVYGALESITVTGSVVDDGDPAELRILLRSDRDGDLAAPAAAADGSFSAAISLSSGDHILTATATDAGDLSDSASVSLSVLTNEAPTRPEVAISPAEPGTDDALTATLTAEAVDPDGDPIRYVWSWTVDGVDAGVDGEVVDPSLTGDDQLWEVSVYATDGDLDGPPATASVLVNDGPAVSVSISPERPTVEDSVSCTWSISDPSGSWDASASWTIDGAAAGDGGEPLEGVFVKGQELVCEVTATSESGATTASAAVAVVNAPPVVQQVVLSPGTATEESTLSCSAVATDADGDGVTLIYTWYVGGAGVSEGATLDGLWFNKNDTVWCEAAGDDGEDLGEPVASSPVIIQNSPPSAPTVGLSPPVVDPGEDLECQVLVEGDDPDGDRLSYSFSWTADGLALAETGDTLDTTALGGRTITCAAQASDGAAVSPWSSVATATVLEAFGGDYTTDDAGLVIAGTEADASFTRVSVPGDLDGDGYSELVVGAFGAGGGDGALYVFSSSLLSGASALEDGDASWSWTGSGSLGDGEATTGIGDIGGDGIAELITGAFKADPGALTDAGEAYLLRSDDRASWGGDIADDAVVTVQGESSADYCGMSAGGGDIDGDGLDDIFVGCYAEDSAANNAGVVGIFTGVAALSGALPISDADVLLTGEGSNDNLGYMGTRFVGDVDGDGKEDLFIAAYNMDGAANNSGVGFVINDDALSDGPATGAAFARLQGLDNGDRFARSGAGMGDVDGDGRADLIVGADKDDDGATDAGAVSFWYGGPTLAGTLDADEADMIWYGETSQDYTGRFVAGGDLDGDGVGDALIAIPYRDDGGSNAGAVALLSGADSTSWTGDLRTDARAWIDGATSSNFLGFGAAIGDATADGYGDVVLGNLYGDDGASNGGTVFVFRGP